MHMKEDAAVEARDRERLLARVRGDVQHAAPEVHVVASRGGRVVVLGFEAARRLSRGRRGGRGRGGVEETARVRDVDLQSRARRVEDVRGVRVPANANDASP